MADTGALGPDFLLDNTRGIQFVHDEYHVTCQATFKNYCQFPKCDCDREEPDHPNTCRCEVCRFWS